MRSQLPVVIEDGPEGFGSQWDGLEPWDLSVVPLQRTNRLFSTVQSELFFFQKKNDSSDRTNNIKKSGGNDSFDSAWNVASRWSGAVCSLNVTTGSRHTRFIIVDSPRRIILICKPNYHPEP